MGAGCREGEGRVGGVWGLGHMMGGGVGGRGEGCCALCRPIPVFVFLALCQSVSLDLCPCDNWKRTYALATCTFAPAIPLAASD